MAVDRINLVTSLGGNTGKTTGDVRMGRIKSLLFTRGKEFTENERADSASFEAALEAAFLLSRTSVNKVFPFVNFREVEDTTGDPQTQTLADGYEEVLNDALVKAVLRHTAGAAQTQSLVAFNGWTDKVYVVDDKNIVWGIKTSSGGMKGFSVGFLYSNPPKFGGTGAINTNQTRIVFGNIDEFKNAGLVALKIDFNVLDLQNIVDVELSEVAAASGYVFTIGAKTKYAGTDIYEAYQDLLAVPGAWKVTRMDTNANVTISAVAKDGTNKGWDVTLDNGTAINQGTKIKFELQDPTTLAGLAAAVEGIESDYVIVTKPA